MPGEVSVSRKIQIRPMTTSGSHSVPVEVVAGEPASLVIGGTGRPIVGKVTAAGAIVDQVDWSFSLNWLHRKQTQVEPPAALDIEAKQKWHEAWRKSPEGKAFRHAQRWYAVKLESPTAHSGSRTWNPEPTTSSSVSMSGRSIRIRSDWAAICSDRPDAM